VTRPPRPEARVLAHFLDAQRAAVLAIVAGLDDRQLRTPALPWPGADDEDARGAARRGAPGRGCSRSTGIRAGGRMPC
jgi:hypothetical protein